MERSNLVLAALSPAGGQPFTPVQVQKLFFIIDQRLASRLGGPKFAFEPYHYGPFDADVYREIEQLARVGFANVEHRGGMRTFALTPQGQARGQQVLESVPVDVREFITKACQFVRQLSFADLVSAIYREFPEMKKNSIFVE